VDIAQQAAIESGVAFAGSISMLDLIMLAIGLGFFMLSVGYTIVCNRL
jgi:hypothetical protein